MQQKNCSDIVLLLSAVGYKVHFSVWLIFIAFVVDVSIATVQRYKLQPSSPGSTPESYLDDVTMTSVTVAALLLTCACVGLFVFVCVRYRARFCSRGEQVSFANTCIWECNNNSKRPKVTWHKATDLPRTDVSNTHTLHCSLGPCTRNRESVHQPSTRSLHPFICPRIVTVVSNPTRQNHIFTTLSMGWRWPPHNCPFSREDLGSHHLICSFYLLLDLRYFVFLWKESVFWPIIKMHHSFT